jgi:hypothetical protein
MPNIIISCTDLAISIVSLTSYSLLIYGAICYYADNGANRNDTCQNIYIAGLLMSTFTTGSFMIYGLIKLGDYLKIADAQPIVVVNPTKKFKSPLRTKRILSSKS